MIYAAYDMQHIICFFHILDLTSHNFYNIVSITYKPTDAYYKIVHDWEKEHPYW